MSLINKMRIPLMTSDAGSKHTKWAKASLCIFSGTLSPEEISAFLAIEPSYFHRRGQSVGRSKPSVLRKHTAWILESGLGDDQDLAEHLKQIVGILERKREAIESLRLSCEVEIRCGFSSESEQGGAKLSKELLSRLAAVRIDLVLDLYPPGPIPGDE
jgi:hypothetical protein